MSKNLSALTVIALASFTSPPVIATPIIGIGSMYDVLAPGSQSITKRIYNTGTSTAFVRVDIIDAFPGKESGGKELQQKQFNGNALEKDRLVVTPQRLIIPPAGFQTVRILWPSDRNEEQYFRVRFTPVLPDSGDGFGIDSNAAEKYRNEALKVGVNVLTGYGTIVIVQPNKPHFNSVVNTNSLGVITVKNNGDTTISLDSIRHCKSVNTDCGETRRQFLLPGRKSEISPKTGFKTNFNLIEGLNSKAMSY